MKTLIIIYYKKRRFCQKVLKTDKESCQSVLKSSLRHRGVFTLTELNYKLICFDFSPCPSPFPVLSFSSLCSQSKGKESGTSQSSHQLSTPPPCNISTSVQPAAGSRESAGFSRVRSTEVLSWENPPSEPSVKCVYVCVSSCSLQATSVICTTSQRVPIRAPQKGPGCVCPL